MKISILNLFLLMTIISSCTVTNNLYVNDPVCEKKGDKFGYIGLGTGRAPKIDSVDDQGGVYFKNQTVMAPSLNFGGQAVLTKNTQARIAIHLPYIIGGIGIRGGVQYSFINSQKGLNAAFGMDFGGVYAHDSIKLFGEKRPLSINSNGSISFDSYIPISIATGEKSRIIITPRFSYNELYIRKNTNYRDSRVLANWYPSISIAAKKENFYFEFTVMKVNDEIIPNFGIVFCSNE